MNYELKTTPKFERLFKKLPEEIQRRVLKRIPILSDDPYRGKALHGSLKGKFSLIVGDYRVIYEIGDKEVSLIAVGHRRRVYDRLER